ncbi:hypothetical protein GYH30_051635 [Glycine max]|uniref:Uncharacterized protein n=1 Tax=Glycine max TaxID=3847 RepID=K7MVS4_SOYBN|nr:hypothetical protein GYH30_051635 [Glycine max]
MLFFFLMEKEHGALFQLLAALFLFVSVHETRNHAIINYKYKDTGYIIKLNQDHRNFGKFNSIILSRLFLFI